MKRLADASSYFEFVIGSFKAGKEKVILFHILRAKQSFFRPEVSIGGVLVALYEKQRRRGNVICVNILSCRRNGLFFATLDTKLRNIL